MQSAKPTVQRRMMFQAPAHVRHKLMAAPLSRDLRKSRKTKTLPLRNGDTVRVMRGDHKGFEGKVNRVDLGKYRIYLEGLSREKVDGTTIPVHVHPSKVMITHLNLDDKWRKKILDRKKGAVEKAEELPEKPKRKRARVVEVGKEGAEEKPTVAEEKAEEKTKEKEPGKRRRAIRRTVEKPVKEEEVATAEEKPKGKRRKTKPDAKRKTGRGV